MGADAEHWIRALALAPHPEGGHYRETYRSAETLPAGALPERFAGPRALATAILYLLRSGERSRLHRLRADEVWHFHGGGPLLLHVLGADGTHRRIELGPGSPQAVIPHGTWFAAEPAAGAAFSLVGCSVAPGFAFEDLELGRRAALLARYPAERALIEQFTDAEE